MSILCLAWQNKIYQGVLQGLGAFLLLCTHAVHTLPSLTPFLHMRAGALWSLRCCVPFIAGTVSERRRALAVRRRVLACSFCSLDASPDSHAFSLALHFAARRCILCCCCTPRWRGWHCCRELALRCAALHTCGAAAATGTRTREGLGGGGALAHTRVFPFGVAACFAELLPLLPPRGAPSPASAAATRGGCPPR